MTDQRELVEVLEYTHEKRLDGWIAHDGAGGECLLRITRQIEALAVLGRLSLDTNQIDVRALAKPRLGRKTAPVGRGQIVPGLVCVRIARCSLDLSPHVDHL